MTVSVLFYGILRKIAEVDQISIPIPRETRVNDLLCTVRERYPQMPLNEDVILLTVNNRIATGEQILEPEDRICFLPHIGGG